MEKVKTALYRHFDEAGRLLYVGISLRPLTRTLEHEAGAHWYQEIAKIEVEWFEDRPNAIEAETAAIRAEKPVHNITVPNLISRRRYHELMDVARQVAAKMSDDQIEQMRRMLEVVLEVNDFDDADEFDLTKSIETVRRWRRAGYTGLELPVDVPLSETEPDET